MDGVPRLPMLSLNLKENQGSLNVEYVGGMYMEVFQNKIHEELGNVSCLTHLVKTKIMFNMMYIIYKLKFNCSLCSTFIIIYLSFTELLQQHIRNNYGDDPAKYKDCIANFLELQASAYSAMDNPNFEGNSVIKKYYGQLHCMQSRFPFEGSGSLNASISW